MKSNHTCEDGGCKKDGCVHCGCNPCICGSRELAEAQHENLEELAKKLAPLVDQLNEELSRHASVCKKTWGDKDAGYPPNCKKGFIEKNGKCVPVKKDEAKHKKQGYAELWKKVNKSK